MLYYTLLDIGTLKEDKAAVLPKGSWKAFLRGPKKTGRGTAPNVRAWGARGGRPCRRATCTVAARPTRSALTPRTPSGRRGAVRPRGGIAAAASLPSPDASAR